MSLVNTLTQALRANYPSNLDKFEGRLSKYGAWEAFKADTNSPLSVVSADVIALAKQSMGNTLSVPVIDSGDVTIGNVRTCTIADTENTSNLVQVTFVPYVFGFKMYPAQYKNNDIKYQEDYNKKMQRYLKKFAGLLDSAAVAKLEADKSPVWDSAFVASGKYPLLADAAQVSQAQVGLIYNDMTSMMAEDDYDGAYNVIGSSTHRAVVGQYANQGANNATNTMFQFGEYNFGAYSNRVTVGALNESTAFVVPEGSLATFNRNDPDSIAGSRIDENNYWGTVQMPVVDLEMGFKYSRACADGSAINAGTSHLTATMEETFIFSTDVAFMTPYISDPVTDPSPIHKLEVTVA
jgi:hypothetical protein